MKKTVIEETRVACTLCGGRGVEYCHQTTSGQQLCRGCSGSGQVLTKTVTRHEVFDLDELAAAVGRYITDQRTGNE